MATTDLEAKAASARTPFKKAFFVANIMEIFERLAWYGFFAVSSVYMTSPLDQGGLGFDDQQRGLLQGLVPFLLYLFPVFTGALGDRYGYKRMFIIAFIILTPSYYLLGQVHSFWAFTVAFLSVAFGAAIFKPLVVGTVSRTTDDTNRGMGFGIFYTMVNLGGFIGPLVAGAVRAVSWDLVFIMSAVWIAINFIPVLFLYKDPAAETARTNAGKSLKDVFVDMRVVLGNGRFALVVVPIIVIIMLTSKWISWSTAGLAILLWVAINIIWSIIVSRGNNTRWYREKIKIGNAPFVMYLLIMAGFWAIYNQIFITLPLYIRDYVDTSDVVHWVHTISPYLAEKISEVNLQQLSGMINNISTEYSTFTNPDTIREIFHKLVDYKVMVPQTEIVSGFQALAGTTDSTAVNALADRWATHYRQVNPEYILSFNFGSILLFQIFVSYFAERRNVFSILMGGTLMIGASFLVAILADSVALGGFICILSVLVFSLGEMLASPKSQDYVAGIMPKSQAAMYMGYYFVSVAIGFLFGGLLSGWAYDTFATKSNRPEIMWIIFSIIGVLTALGLFAFNKLVAPKLEAQRGLHT